MPVFQIEMRWRCAACHTENLGRHKRCQNCTKGKDVEKFYDAPDAGAPSLSQAVTDPRLIAAATAGADWACGYCRVAQPASRAECANCGAPRNDPEHPGTPVAKAAAPAVTQAARPVAQPAVPTESLEEMAARVSASSALRRSERFRKRALIAAVVSACLFLGALGLWSIFRTRVLEARVVERSWEHTVVVERYQIVSRESFAEGRPGDAFDVVDMGKRHHHDDRVRDGTERESYTVDVACGEDCRTTSVTCTENDNGFKTCSGGDQVCSTRYCSETRYREVPRYKDVPVYATWYRWRAWQWAAHRSLVEKGSVEPPRWSTDEQIRLGAECGEGEKERSRREAKYGVVFLDDDAERHPFTPQSLEAFEALPMGATRKVRVGIAQDAELVTNE